ncbi:MAG: hypothetical protein RR996_01825 [Alistipes sp.]
MPIKHASYGVSHTLPAPFNECVVTDFSDTSETLHAYEYDNVGAVIGDTVYDRHGTATATIQVPTALTLPKGGEIMTIDSIVYAVMSCNLVQSNKDYNKVQLTLERYAKFPTATEKPNDLTIPQTPKV